MFNKVLVYGFSTSGQAVCQLLIDKCDVYVFDDKVINDAKLKELKAKKLNLKNYKIDEFDCIIISPGVPLTSSIILEAKEKGVAVIGEIEFAYLYAKSKNIIGITGTNGKTTCTELITHLLMADNPNVYKCGNVGIPFSSVVECGDESSIFVTELSSFQLETIKEFSPKISVILNLSPDHLDRYNCLEDYYNAKLNVLNNLSNTKYCILNYDDERLRYLNPNCETMYFSLKEKVKGCYLKDDIIYFNNGQEDVKICDTLNVKIEGEHNLSNILASVLVAYLCNKSKKIIQDGINSFSSLVHRCEKIKTIRGVTYINDSKATNIASTLVCVKNFRCKVHLLLGGSDKGEDFRELFKNLSGNIKVYLFGNTVPNMVRACKECNFSSYYIAYNMYNALVKAYLEAGRGDVVVLSPACASFDAFKNYEERGKYFKQWVDSLGDDE